MDDPRPKRRRIGADERRAQIVSVAREIFIRDGMSAPTKSIAAAAGVDSALIYHYFGSKDALFQAAILEPLTELVDEMGRGAEQLAESTEPAERYDVLRDRHGDMARIVGQIVPLLGIALFSDPKAGQTFYREHLAPALHDIAVATSKGMAGWTRAGLDSHDVVLSTFGTHLAYALHTVVGHHDDPTAAERINELLWLGLAGSTR